MNRFLLGVEEFNLIDSFKSPMKDNFIHQFFTVVVSYLFFDYLTLFHKNYFEQGHLYMLKNDIDLYS